MGNIEDIEMLSPRTLREALALQSDAKTRGMPLAGGTDLFVQWESGARPVPERVVDLKLVPELRVIEEKDGAVVIGASATHAMIRRSPLVLKHLPSLAEACGTVGGAQIQALGTIAGSVANASPAGDLAPSLLISGGTVVVASAAGEREVPLSGFWTGYRKIDLKPEEIIVRFVLPKKKPAQREAFRKLGPRAAQAISKVMGSWRGEADGGVVRSFAVALGSVAPTAVRLAELEGWITGKKLTVDVLDEAEARAAKAIKPITDIRSTAEYRQWVAGRVVRGFLEDLARAQ